MQSTKDVIYYLLLTRAIRGYILSTTHTLVFCVLTSALVLVS